LVGRASALLASPRAAAFAALAVGLGAYYTAHESLVDLSLWWEVAFLGLCLMPAVFAMIWLALPYRNAGGLYLLALAFLLLSVILEVADLEALANFAKLGLMTSFGFWFLGFFESVLWVALVALVIPIVDSFSVWRGPTRHIVEEEPEIFDVFSFAFPFTGEASSANLGLPDLLFFALFLAAAARWQLRVGWTWIALTASIGLTMALAVAWDVAGLPALPGLAFAFLLPNADRLWAAFVRWRRLRRLSPRDQDVVRKCLTAALHGPFFPEEQFHSLMGLTRNEVRDVIRAWPDGAAPVEQDLAVNNVLVSLLGHPDHEHQAWDDYVSVTREEVESILARWRGEPARDGAGATYSNDLR
jgi:hypothetical protein